MKKKTKTTTKKSKRKKTKQKQEKEEGKTMQRDNSGYPQFYVMQYYLCLLNTKNYSTDINFSTILFPHYA